MEVQEALNQLWAGIIRHHDLDLLRNALAMQIDVVDHISVPFTVQLAELSGIYFVQSVGERRFVTLGYEEGDHLELTSIQYVEGGIGAATLTDMLPDWHRTVLSKLTFRPNVVMEIWSSWLLVEAGRVRVNDDVFELVR